MTAVSIGDHHIELSKIYTNYYYGVNVKIFGPN